MKQLIITIVLILTAAANAQAQRSITINNGIGGLLLGAGGGALAGQAIGRNTESTLIGTAVGTLFGYVVGNEMDKGNGQQAQVMYRPAPAPAPAPAQLYRDQRSDYRPRYEPVEHYSYYPENECREVEILGTLSGDPERIITTACRTPQGWVLVDPPGRPVVNSRNPENYRNPNDRVNYRPASNNYTRHIRYQY